MPWLLLLPLLGGGFLGGILLFSRARSGDSDSGGGSTSSEKAAAVSDRQQALRRALAAAGIAQDAWLRFFEATAYRETRGSFSTKAWNKTDKEKAASRNLVFRKDKNGKQPNVDKLKAIGQNPDAWAFGSKGFFQLLGPAVALEGSGSGYRFPKSAIEPNMAFDPGISVAAAMDFARGLMQWPNFDGTWASLAKGWGNPSKMGDVEAVAKSAERIEHWGKLAGWPAGWAYDKVPPLPSRTASDNLTIAKAAKAAYYA